jgi:hypothetical protein
MIASNKKGVVIIRSEPLGFLLGATGKITSDLLLPFVSIY